MIKIPTYTDTTLTDTHTPSADAINTGTAVSLNCTGVEYNFGVFTQVPPLPGKSPTAFTHSQLLAQGDYIGFDNPIITITGIIDLKKYDTTTGAPPSNIINLKLLQQFAKCGRTLTLTDEYDSSTTTPIYRISTLSGTFPSETVTTVSCQVISFNLRTNPERQSEGHLMFYTLNLKEVQ